MTRNELTIAAIDFLGRAFAMEIEPQPHVVGAAVSIVLSSPQDDYSDDSGDRER